MDAVRRPAVAGAFYSREAALLQAEVASYLAAADASGVAPKAIIAPHAGYIYSGPIAASVYARLASYIAIIAEPRTVAGAQRSNDPPDSATGTVPSAAIRDAR